MAYDGVQLQITDNSTGEIVLDTIQRDREFIYTDLQRWLFGPGTEVAEATIVLRNIKMDVVPS